MLTRRRVLIGLGAAALAPSGAAALPAWPAIAAAARGQEVFFNAWGGDPHTNDFIAWTDARLRATQGVAVRQVKLADTAEAVTRVLAERAAGRVRGGSIDLIWINGPNFLAMKQRGLLFGPVLDALPNAALLDRAAKPTLLDFTVPTDGLEVPWRMARVVFVHDSARLPEPPRTMAAMLEWARAHPGRLTHPTASNFLGATFLKQALVELAPDRAVLARPVTDAGYAAAAAPLWAWYRALRPYLWHHGRTFPETGPAQTALMADGEIDLFISFNPAEAALDIADGTLPPTTRAYVLRGGTLANCSFVAIPFDAAHWQGAMVVANFLLSPEAQAHAADPGVLGSPTVLALDRLSPADRARFDRLPTLPGLLTPAELGAPLPEPHPSWMGRVTADWERLVEG
jgi:putative thiamine transport system substrate-binding protein